MNFADIFKSSFLESFASSQTDTFSIVFNLIVSAVFGVFIFLIYRAVTKKTFYVNTFNISLVAMSIITSAIIITIQSNIVLSLGMVGALSIVRFRTAVKDPLDLVFLYWSISVGIICGAGLAHIAAILSLIVSLAMFLLGKYPNAKQSMILVINSKNTNAYKDVIKTVEQFSKYYKIKSKNLTAASLDIIIEVRINKESELIYKIMEIEGITSASLLSHDGDITAN